MKDPNSNCQLCDRTSVNHLTGLYTRPGDPELRTSYLAALDCRDEPGDDDRGAIENVPLLPEPG